MGAGNRAQVVDQRDGAGHAGAEADAVVGSRYIVIHRFWDSNDLEAFLIKPHAVTQRIVPADRDQVIDPKEIQVLQDFGRQVVALFGIFVGQVRRHVFLLDPGCVRARGVQECPSRSPSLVDHVLCQDLEIVTVIRVLLAHNIHQPAPAALQADYLVAFADGPHCYGTDGWIQSRHVTAAGQDANDARFLLRRHTFASLAENSIRTYLKIQVDFAFCVPLLKMQFFYNFRIDTYGNQAAIILLLGRLA